MLLHFTMQYLRLMIFMISFLKASSHKFSRFSTSSFKYTDFSAYYENTSTMQCLALCDGRDSCASVNYNLETERCELTPYALIIQTPATATETDWRVYHKECPSDWEFFHGLCYLFSKDFRTWDSSKTFCESENASLVMVADAAKDSYIRSVISVQQYHHFYWIGGQYDVTYSEFRWIDQTAITFDGWGPGTPVYAVGCMAYLNHGDVVWQWTDHPHCFSTSGPCICEINERH